MRLIVAIGARPNVVKVSPLLPEFARAGIEVDLAFTGSRRVGHPEDEGGAVSFFGVEIASPRWFLDVGAGTDADTTGRAMVAFEDLFASERPDAVMAIGDSNSALAVAISAAKACIPVVHLDAGLRCGDLRVPEEVNRVLISRVASVHLTPSERALENLEDEAIEPERIHFVGSPMAESVLRHVDDISRLRACGEYGLTEGTYILGSFHREENLGTAERLSRLIEGMSRSSLPVLVPDARDLLASVERYGLSVPSSIRIVESVPYRSMLSLERDAACVITDSGGVQVESCLLCVPCLTVRACTEMTSTVAVGANQLVALDPEAIRIALSEVVVHPRTWLAPQRWDRAVSDRVARILKRGVSPLV